MQVKRLDLNDLITVLSDLSEESKIDVATFNNSRKELIDIAMDAYPFAWTICSEMKPECVCWYNVIGPVAQTYMLYSKDFLKNKGITPVVKQLIDENSIIAKDGGVELIELHSTLSHPLSETWYQKLGFSKTNKTYPMGNKTISIFERRI